MFEKPINTPRSVRITIGVLSRLTGVNIETIRYYERIGLMPPPPRTEAGQRRYDEAHVRHLNFVRRGRELGFPLEEVRIFLRLAEGAAPVCCVQQAKDLALNQLANVRGKIASLKKLERALKTMTDACRPGDQGSCPVIDAFGPRAQSSRR